MAKGFGKRQSTLVRKSERNKAKHLFQQGFSYFQSGKFTKAEASFRKLLASQGDRTDAWKMLGNVYYQQGNITDAIAAYERIVKLQPNNADAWSNLGVLYVEQKKPDRAIAAFKQAIHLQPNSGDAHNNLGQLYLEQKQLTAAEKHLQQAIKCQPNLAIAHYNLGNLYKSKHQFDLAIAAYQQTIKIQPNYNNAYNNLGNAYLAKSAISLAIEYYQQEINRQPNCADAYNNLGIAYYLRDDLAKAIECYQQANQLKPNNAHVYYHQIANAYKKRGDFTQAIDFYQASLKLKPDYHLAHQDLLLFLHYSSEYSPTQIFARHQEWYKLHCPQITTTNFPQVNQPKPDKKIRIGYVSGDFFGHPVTYFLQSLLANHNHDNYEIFCYNNSFKTDAVTDKLKQFVDRWREIYNLDDEQADRLIRQDEIDILVDLSGHTGDNRLLLFAAKPAPIQVTYLGYPNTTGLGTIDYRFTDAYADPQGQTEHLHSEKLIRLPNSFLCYQPSASAPKVEPPPVITNGYITFGSFNNIAKVSKEVISYWAKILQAVPNSRLLLKYGALGDRETCDRLDNLFAQAGIEPNRLDLRGWVKDANDHLATYNEVDIALDTYPYHGTTTTCEAMWMGVPVITLAGKTHVSRVGVSLLSSVGLSEFIAEFPEEYISKAVNLANNRHKLAKLREYIRYQLESSPLTDGNAIAQSIESAYRQMWQDWCIQREQRSRGAKEQRSRGGRGSRGSRGAEGEIDVREQLKLAQGYYCDGKLDEAIACLRSIQQVEPKNIDVWYLLGNTYLTKDEFSWAWDSYLQALKLENNLDSLNLNQENSLEQILALPTKNASALNGLAIICIKQKQRLAAVKILNKVIELSPNYADAYNNLGQLHKELDKLAEAEQYFQQAIEIELNFATAHYNLGNVYKSQDELTKAIAAYQQALAIEPNHQDVHNNLGNTYLARGDVSLALQCYRQAAQTRSEQNLLFALHYSSEFSPEYIYQQHLAWGEKYEALISQKIKSHQNEPNPDRKLNIGYVSTDFKAHSVSYFFESLLANCARQNFSITCYANNEKSDNTTARLQSFSDRWRYIYDLDDEEVAELIRQDGIDILVDLGGHTSNNRLLIFAYKPAPIQVTYLGYPNTTGLKAIDYRFTDPYADPEGTTEHLHTEELFRLPQGFLCYQAPPETPEVNALPAQTKGYVTFGSFNNVSKVSTEIIGYWAQILHKVPNSRLLLKYKALQDIGTAERIYQLFAAAGIESHRLDLRGWIQGTNNHLSLYHEVDIALDTYPYHGTTTTCEALWMGVPVITLAGKTHVSRVGVSLLSSVGLKEFIANSPEEYIAKAVDLANNSDKLAQLRANFRFQIESSPLTDGKAIATSIESAYRQMWQDWCQEKSGVRSQKSKVETFHGTSVQKSEVREDREENFGFSEKIKLAMGYYREGKFSEAIACLQSIQQVEPDNIDVWHLWGHIARRQGNLDKAIASYRNGIQIQPDNINLHLQLGNVYLERGELSLATRCYQQVLELQPNCKEAYSNLGNVYQELGNLVKAIEFYQQALAIEPNYAHAHHNLAVVYGLQGNYPQQRECYQQLTKIEPQNSLNYLNLGKLWQKSGHFSKAIKSYQQAIELQPDNADAHSSLGVAYNLRGHLTKAIACYCTAIKLKPDNAYSYYHHLANVYKNRGDISQAINCYQKSLELKPDYNFAHRGLLLSLHYSSDYSPEEIYEQHQAWGNTVRLRKVAGLGKHGEQRWKPLKGSAVPSSSATLRNFQSAKERALRGTRPTDCFTASAQDAREADERGLGGFPPSGSAVCSSRETRPPQLLHHERLVQERPPRQRKQWSRGRRNYADLNSIEAWGKIQPNVANKRDFSHNPNPDRKLRIGYVSGDFKHHAVAHFVEPLLKNCDRANFDIYCYANNIETDATTDRLKQLVDGWQEIHHLDDKQVSKLIQQDSIDILVDLSGHTMGDRLLVFNYKPAPIQVTYLGYPDTTGLESIDYRFTDAYADPQGQTEHLHTETLIRLQHGFLCYQPPTDTPPTSASPVITNNYITFGSFNNVSKVSPEIIGYWANILKKVPNSRLLLKSGTLQDNDTRDRLYKLFAEAGIEPNRLDLRGWIQETTNHLALYNKIDIALDTYPYNGTTTTCEALWMGVPVITLAGKTHVSRVGVSLLSAAGLNEFIADSPEAYISKAVDLAFNIDKLTELRANIRPQMDSSPLTDGKLSAQSIESAYRQMWQDWCRGAEGQRGRGAEEAGVETFHGTSLQNSEAIKIRLNQAIKHQQLKEFTQAEQILQQVIQQYPDHSDAWHLLGSAYYQQAKLDQAIACYQKSREIEPNNIIAIDNLGVTCIAKGDVEKALSYWQEVMKLQPNHNGAWQNILFCLHYISKYSPEEIFAQHQAWGKLHRHLAIKQTFTPERIESTKKLRIGYVSADFTHHPVAYFLQPLFANSDRHNFEIYCYANNVKSDAFTNKLKQLAHSWREIHHLNDKQVADLIKELDCCDLP